MEMEILNPKDFEILIPDKVLRVDSHFQLIKITTNPVNAALFARESRYLNLNKTSTGYPYVLIGYVKNYPYLVHSYLLSAVKVNEDLTEMKIITNKYQGKGKIKLFAEALSNLLNPQNPSFYTYFLHKSSGEVYKWDNKMNAKGRKVNPKLLNTKHEMISQLIEMSNSF